MEIQIEKIKSLIIEGNLEEGLNLLIKGTKNNSFETESTLIVSRYSRLKKEKKYKSGAVMKYKESLIK